MEGRSSEEGEVREIPNEEEEVSKRKEEVEEGWRS